MATKKLSKKALENSVVVLETHIGHDLVIRANPSDDEVRGFAEEHHRRYIAGEPGGPSGIPAYRLFNAKRYVSEESFDAGDEPVAEIDLSDLLPST